MLARRVRRTLVAIGATCGVLATLAGCSRRDRANPLDIENPLTQGRPTGFNALAGFLSVRLQWDARPTLGLDGFQLERRASPDSAYRPITAVLPATRSVFLDGAVANGIRYQYRLYYVRGGERVSSPAEDVATPGGLRPWIVDSGFNRPGFVATLTPDGRDILVRYDSWDSPTSLAVDGQTSGVWVSDPFRGEVGLLNPSTGAVSRYTGLGQPFSIALDPLNGNAWVCDLDGFVRHFSPDGSIVVPSQIPLFESPGGIAVWRQDRSFWVCERNGNRLRRYDAAGNPLFATGMASPSRVAVDSASGRAYVTSLASGTLLRLQSNGARVDSSRAASGPIGLALDAARGVVWVADAVGNQLVAFRTSDLSVSTRVANMPGVRDVAVDPNTGEVWAVVNGLGEVWRLGPSGVLLDRTGGFENPQEVRLDDGAR